MELTKPFTNLMDDDLDDDDVELLNDEEIEEGVLKLKSMFTPEELDEMFAPKIDEEYVESIQWEPSEKHKRFMEQLFQHPYDDFAGKQ